jgi:hypothetical protein
LSEFVTLGGSDHAAKPPSKKHLPGDIHRFATQLKSEALRLNTRNRFSGTAVSRYCTEATATVGNTGWRQDHVPIAYIPDSKVTMKVMKTTTGPSPIVFGLKDTLFLGRRWL